MNNRDGGADAGRDQRRQPLNGIQGISLQAKRRRASPDLDTKAFAVRRYEAECWRRVALAALSKANMTITLNEDGSGTDPTSSTS